MAVSAKDKFQDPCWPYRFNNPFVGDPEVTQITSDLVRISWRDVVDVESPFCVDNFFVRFWEKGKYFGGRDKRTNLLGKTTYVVDVPVEEGKAYKFQVVAIRDGFEKFKTEPPVEFATTSASEKASPATFLLISLAMSTFLRII